MSVTTIIGESRSRRSQGMAAARARELAFYAASALLFVASAAQTIVWCASMSAIAGMPMPGGWTMSMAWMRMPGQTWPGAAASFLGMWIVMMIAMMQPSLTSMLSRYRAVVGRTSDATLGRLTLVAGLGYFVVWAAIGASAFVVGVTLAMLEMQQPLISRGVPLATGVILVAIGALQFTSWKAHHLRCCREMPPRNTVLPANTFTAWRHGLRLGLHCGCCSGGLTLALLALGVMDPRVMAGVTAAITLERFAPSAERIAHAIGAAVVIAGLLLIAQAAGSGWSGAQ